MMQHPWDQFTALKDEAYLYIDQGLRLEQTKRPDRVRCHAQWVNELFQHIVFAFQALIMYERGLEQLDKALDLPIEVPGSTGDALEKLRKTRTKMVRTRQEIVFRIRELQSEDSKEESPPSYEQATGSLPSDALIMFHIPDKVNIFYINAQGQVTTPYEPSALYLYKFSSSDETPALLQVGSWVYPLVPGKSPVLKSRSGSYMFPDLDASIEGNAVGIILPPEVTEDQKAGFEALLEQLTAVQREDLSEYDEYIAVSGKVAEGMTQGAEVVGKGLVKASIKGAQLMKKGTEKLKENMVPAANSIAVDPKLKTGLEAASWTADKAVKVSGYLGK